MSTSFKEKFSQLDPRDEIDQLRQRISRVERSGGGSGGGSSTPWYDVTDYGASGDGSAADTDEIQSAIDAAGDDRKAVYFPSGDYKITSPLIGAEKVPLLGEGRYQAVIHQDDPSEHAIDLKGASNLTIEGLGVTHDHGLDEQDRGQCLFSGAAVENVTVRDCAFTESARQAVGFWSGDNRNIRFERNDLAKCARAGVVMFGEGLAVIGCYINGTGDDAIALNTDGTTRSTIGGNIVIDGAGVGEQTGGAIKFHGRNINVVWNGLFDSNQYAIRGQIVDERSGEGTDVSPRRDRVANNLIHRLTDANPETQTRAAIEMREFQSITIGDNSVYDIGDKIGILLRNDAQDDTRAKLNDNYVEGAGRAVQVEDRHGFIDISDLTVYDVDRTLLIRDPVDSLHFRDGSGDDVGRCVSFSSVDGGSYHLRGNWFTDVDSSNLVDGSLDSGAVNNYLNVPSGETSRVRSNADYDAVRWSHL